jgi:D-glycero-D-manno-heptose 1,7-bisphosphate phosphatase
VRPAAFLDRDGVINVDRGFTYLREDLVFTPTAVEAIKAFNDAGHRVFVVTNQSGVARGYYTIADVERFHECTEEQLRASGAHVDCFYYCPFHPEGSVAEYAIDHDDRKPRPGMLLRAIREWPTDVAASVMIGDKESDIQVATAAGLTGLLVLRTIQMIQRDRLVGWVERKRNPSSAVVAMVSPMLNPSYRSWTLNHVIGSEH